MKICKNNHTEIVYTTNKCPLCILTEHNNMVHSLNPELVKSLDEKRQQTKNNDTCNCKYITSSFVSCQGILCCNICGKPI